MYTVSVYAWVVFILVQWVLLAHSAAPTKEIWESFRTHLPEPEVDVHHLHHEQPGVVVTYNTRLPQRSPLAGTNAGGSQGFSSQSSTHATRPFLTSQKLHGPPPPALPSDLVKIKPSHEGPGGCLTSEGFYYAGQIWYTKGCRRRTCIHFRGTFITETDSCDSEIFNTTYKCIVLVDIHAQYPDCCPKYRCNPDNLGNSVK
ncbi:hypothetical protein OTU49_017510 [Cherax quadricarinatus]|uniref:Single domain-containing protein n=1 Tax=Cherax quadricarinatus TaxID=27406 RepID=A0AAW0VQJ1_CHEQU